jgi:hypothetical protein
MIYPGDTQHDDDPNFLLIEMEGWSLESAGD